MVPTVRFHRLAVVALVWCLPPATAAAQTFDSSAFAGMRWREIGPYRGGRSVAVAGSAKRASEYWMGTTGGGVFKTTDGGMSWQPSTDRYFGGTIGALAVSESNPDIVWAGGGESDIRGNAAPGEGVWITRDAGRSWTRIEFFDVKNHVNRIRIHPSNPDIVWIGVLGHAFGPNEQRGVFKTSDGGKTWKKVLYRDEKTGVSDLALDATNPNVLYAAFWNAYRTPWSLNSGGPGGGIFKSTDGGETWRELTASPGLPKGILGKIGIAVSPAKSSRVWALIEAEEGGVYRSDDGGSTWAKMNEERKLRQRAWYYTRVYADPRDTNIVYAVNTGFYRSRDGGKTFSQSIQVPHGDNHDVWIAPDDPNRMINANDGGANVSVNAGRAWTPQTFATAQMYHVETTNHFPYKVCGAQQDNSTLCGPSRRAGGIRVQDWLDAGGGESGYIAANPIRPDIVFAGSYGGLLTRKDMRTEITRDVNPWPDNPMGISSEDIKYKFQWTFPIVFSPHDPGTMYVGGSNLFVTHDEGQSYQIISPALARNDPKTLGPSGGPITKDQTGVETYGVVFTVAESPLVKGVIWTGSDDGLVQVTKDAGKTWKNVTPKDIGEFARVSLVEAGRFNAGTAYVAANRYQQDDFSPILFKTSDYGTTWTKIVDGIAPDDFARAIREDPTRPGLLYAGTEHGVYVSFDAGAHWQSLRLNLPRVPVHDLAVKEGDLVAATHGRSFYIIDDLSPLRQLSSATLARDGHLYKPRDVHRIDWGGGRGGGGAGASGTAANPPSGVRVFFSLKQASQDVTLDFLDGTGKVINSFSSKGDSTPATGRGRGGDEVTTPDEEVGPRRPPPPPRVSNSAGLNAFVWNMRYPDAATFDGIILWAGETRGPIAPQGTYSVRMRINGGAPQTQTFRLKNDPRSTATAADQLAQFNFEIKLRDRLTAANEAVISMRYVKGEVDDRIKRAPASGTQEITAEGASLRTNLTGVEAEVYQIRNQSSQDPLNFPIKLNNKLAALLGSVSSAPGRPTAQATAVFNELDGQLEKQMVRMRKIYVEDLARYNALLKKYGLPAIDTKPKPKITA
ncbi:MAG TPA: glycosyl hydrolase [Gemmatimonadaceae bacterium]|nr:glycosyl hydrolase [Gemmatimonadaceae bacterium]